MRGLYRWLSQVGSVTRLSLATLLERRGMAAAAIFGIAGVVAVFVAVLSIAEGFRRVMLVSGDPSRVLVMRSGSDSEMMSFLAGPETRLLLNAPGVQWSEQGPLVSRELFTVINLPKQNTGTDANVPLRGVDLATFEVHHQVRIVEGRRFEPGRNEVVVGRGAAMEFRGLELGAELQVGRNRWRVVGVFEANGGLAESEIWTDASVLQAAYQRGNSYQSLSVQLETPETFDRFREFVGSDPRLNVKVIRQTEYYAEQSTTVYNLITGLGTVVAALMAVGAVFGALNTMYTAVASRTREIATLRALGFGSSPIVVSVMVESLVLAAIGGVIGGAAAYLCFDGFHAATMNWQSFSQVAFAFSVTPGLLLQGALYAAAIGLVGGLFPAIRAAHLPIARALREL